MLKNKTGVFFAAILVFAVVLVIAQFSRFPTRLSEITPTPVLLNQVADHSFITAQLGSQTLQIEVVNTPESIIQGLSGRDTLGADGMLFVLPRRTIPSFWMKEMQFDLDMVLIDDFAVVDITPNVPQPTEAQRSPAALRSLPTYSPQNPATMVLEIEAGKAAAWGVHIGDTLQFTK